MPVLQQMTVVTKSRQGSGGPGCELTKCKETQLSWQSSGPGYMRSCI